LGVGSWELGVGSFSLARMGLEDAFAL
jgi:hypothetical protein